MKVRYPYIKQTNPIVDNNNSFQVHKLSIVSLDPIDEVLFPCLTPQDVFASRNYDSDFQDLINRKDTKIQCFKLNTIQNEFSAEEEKSLKSKGGQEKMEISESSLLLKTASVKKDKNTNDSPPSKPVNPYAKFRFPSKDPEPSNIIDERSPLQILDDILRLSSQILNPAETELWSQICERDLRKVTKNQYLSGIRKIASDIKNEIAEF